MTPDTLSRRAVLAASVALGVAAAAPVEAAPLKNLCLEIPCPPPPSRGFVILQRMAWAGSLITTMQEGVDPDLERDLHDMAFDGLFEITRRRNPPREISVPGHYAVEHETGWTLSVKTTPLGKIHGLAAHLPQAQAEAFMRQGLAACARYGFDTPEPPRSYHYPTPARPAVSYVSAEEADRFFWRLDSIDTAREPWLLMVEGMTRPRSVGPDGVITWERTDYGATLMRIAGAPLDDIYTFRGTPA